MNELYHHGVKGQKWGVRRYQNPDGSLTPEGIKRAKSYQKYVNKMANKSRSREDLLKERTIQKVIWFSKSMTLETQRLLFL